jgi:hypothetical protein
MAEQEVRAAHPLPQGIVGSGEEEPPTIAGYQDRATDSETEQWLA